MCRYVGADGVYTHTVAYERDAACTVCSSSVPFEIASTDTLQQVWLDPPYTHITLHTPTQYQITFSVTGAVGPSGYCTAAHVWCKQGCVAGR